MAARDQPLTPVGRLFLQPSMYQVINVSVGLDSPIDADAIKAILQSSLLLQHPRFCSLMVRNSRGREHWRRTPINIHRHVIVHRHPLASTSYEEAVNDFIADLSSSPLPVDKPLWEVHLLLEHRTAVFRLHHALGDGISLMSMMLSFCRRADDPDLPPNFGAVRSTERRRRRFSVWTLLKSIWFTLIYCVEFAVRSLWLKDKTTAVSGGRGAEVRPRSLATARFRLDDMKIVKKAVDNATINDVLFGIIACGLSRYLDIRSPEALPEGLRITGVAMVNLRRQVELQQDMSKLADGKSLGNKFGMLLLPVYYHKGGSNPIDFVKRAKAMIDKKKISLEGPFSYRVGKLAMCLFGARFASILNYRIVCNTTFTISNIVGPQEEITFAGNHVNHMRVTSSSLPHAITMHMVSYAGNADLQILAAKDKIPDPQVLAKCFEDALLEMSSAAGKP